MVIIGLFIHPKRKSIKEYKQDDKKTFQENHKNEVHKWKSKTL